MNNAGPILIAVLNSLWQAAIVAALVWLALRYLPRAKFLKGVATNAATRHAIWWAVLMVVLVLPAARPVISWVGSIESRARPVAKSAPSRRVGSQIPSAIPEVPAIVVLSEARTARWPAAILAAWAAIFLFRSIQIARSYFYLRGVKARASVSPQFVPAIARPVRLLLSRDIGSPMAIGFLKPAIILPESLPSELDPAELDHVVLHEAAHLARRDDWTNLAVRVLGAILALHPVALWILRQIEREREIACDDWVVEQTGAAKPYAASLARMFELRWAKRGSRAGEALASGIFGGGSRLGERIELLLRGGRGVSARISKSRLVASAVALLLLAAVSSRSAQWIALAQSASFEVASIRPNQSGNEGSIVNFPETGRLSVTNATLRTLIRGAYSVQADQIRNGPKWLDTDKYDIQARTAGPIREQEEGPLLQNLLSERFHLKVHREMAEQPIYLLTRDKNGPKFNQNTDGIGSMETSRGVQRVRIAVKRISMMQLAGMLSRQLGRVVENQTGLSGYYDFAIEWDPDPSADSSLPSVFAALQEQLGLRLESSRGPVPMLVIDHVERPDAN